MKTNTIKNVLFALLALTLLSFEMPSGWFKTGSDSNRYDMGIEKGAGFNGKNAATIKSIEIKIMGYGALAQSFSPEKYLGKRIRFSGFVKTKDVAERACLWMRIGQANSQNFLAIDNMQNRPIVGSTDWKKYEIVLDVPTNASKISYGALVKGTGQIWFDNLTFEVVDESIPATGRKTKKNDLSNDPSNLDFDI